MSRDDVIERGGGRPVLVTGGAGFIGCNIADRLAREGHQVLIYDALSRPGVEANLEWLKQRHPNRIASIIADIRDEDELARAAREAKTVFHMAAQDFTEGLAELAEWVAGETADDRVDQARAELEARGLVA